MEQRIRSYSTPTELIQTNNAKRSQDYLGLVGRATPKQKMPRMESPQSAEVEVKAIKTDMTVEEEEAFIASCQGGVVTSFDESAKVLAARALEFCSNGWLKNFIEYWYVLKQEAGWYRFDKGLNSVYARSRTIKSRNLKSMKLNEDYFYDSEVLSRFVLRQMVGRGYDYSGLKKKPNLRLSAHEE